MTEFYRRKRLVDLMNALRRGVPWSETDNRDFTRLSRWPGAGARSPIAVPMAEWGRHAREYAALVESTPETFQAFVCWHKQVVGHETFRDALRAYLTERARIVAGE